MRLNYSIHFEYIGELNGSRILLKILSNYSGTPQFRIYEDGGIAPAFANCNLLFGNEISPPAGVYRVEYKDDNGERLLSKIQIYDFALSCWDNDNVDYNELGFNSTIFVSDVGISMQSTIRRFLSANPAYNRGIDRSFSIDGGATFKAVTNPTTGGDVQWTNSEIIALGISNVISEIFIRRDISGTYSGCTTMPASDLLLDDLIYDPTETTYTKTDSTANGADDGTITLSTEGGSGNFSYLWNDGEITQNRSGLAPGTYSVVIHDITTGEDETVTDIQILEPQAETVSGTLLEFPVLNTLHFVVDPKGSEITADSSIITADSDEITVDAIDDDSRRTPDNVLFADQVFGNFARACYWQKHVFTDEPIIQFNSDFGSHIVQLINQRTGDVVRSFSSNLVEQNIGIVEDFGITIRNHVDNPGKSRVYFNVGALPIPLNVGDIFNVINNGEGFNGGYSILEIVNDVLLGYQYLVINLNYTGAGSTSAATGRFLSSAENYNVHETTLNFLDLDEDRYYVKVTAFNVLNDTEVIGKIGVSEPIHLKAIWPNTNLIEYRNVDNGYGDITWTTGYIGRIRVESLLGHKRLTSGGERGVSRNSDYSPVKTYAKKVRAFLFETFMLPPYLHEKLGLIFDCDSWTINGVAYQATEGYADPSYLFKVKLSNSSIRIEQLNWMRRYNSHDIGTVAEGGFLLTEQGFLKL